MQTAKVEDLTTLSDNEEAALIELISLCKEELDLQKIILYGSKARGDYTLDSDVDILVFVGEPLDSSLRSKMSDIAFEVNYKYNSNLSCIVRNLESFYESGFVSLITEAKREGVLLEY